MEVPRHIRPCTSDDNYIPHLAPSSKVNHVDGMIVPDRIIVAGGNEIIGDKPTPLEIAMDMQAYTPARNAQYLETPPARLTLQDRTFPTVDDADRRHKDRSSPGPTDSPKKSGPPNPENHGDGLPQSSAMSLLSPAEELTLLRHQVRKLTTRVQKMEEEVQDANRHISWVESVGSVMVLLIILKSMKAVFWPSHNN